MKGVQKNMTKILFSNDQKEKNTGTLFAINRKIRTTYELLYCETNFFKNKIK